MPQEAAHIKNKDFFIFRHIHRLHFMYFEVPWVLVSSGSSAANNTPSRLPSRDYVKNGEIQQ